MQCSICLDDLDASGPTLACGHRFHASCLARLAGANGTTPTRRGALTACPNCRTVSRVAPTPVAAFGVGDRVDALWGYKWYPGVVDEVLEGGYQIAWDDGDEGEVPAAHVRAEQLTVDVDVPDPSTGLDCMASPANVAEQRHFAQLSPAHQELARVMVRQSRRNSTVPPPGAYDKFYRLVNAKTESEQNSLRTKGRRDLKGIVGEFLGKLTVDVDAPTARDASPPAVVAPRAATSPPPPALVSSARPPPSRPSPPAPPRRSPRPRKAKVDPPAPVRRKKRGTDASQGANADRYLAAARRFVQERLVASSDGRCSLQEVEAAFARSLVPPFSAVGLDVLRVAVVEVAPAVKVEVRPGKFHFSKWVPGFVLKPNGN